MSAPEELTAAVRADLAAARAAARSQLARAHERGRRARTELELARARTARSLPTLDARRSAALAQLHRGLERQPGRGPATAGLDSARAADAREIEQSYLDACAAAAAEVTSAAQQLARASADARAAATLVTDADAEVAVLWRELGRQLGRRRALGLGPPPPPGPQPGADEPAVPLSRAVQRLAVARRSAEAWPLLLLIWVVGGLVAGWALVTVIR